MFTKARNIETAFGHIRIFTLTIISGSILFCCYALYKSYQIVSAAHQKVYILAGGKVLEASASERSENIPVEARDHIASFHKLFFTLDPDDKVIEENLSKALYLADQSAKKQYDNLKESGYFAAVISGNISQQIRIDSVQFSTADYPYPFRCVAVQRIIRPSSIVSRTLVTTGFVRNVSRSDNNPHGFLIEKWTTLENKDISIERR
ncbi:conjugative transposon protein TraK [Dyadobacter psychrotolerans]|uniref:Conjugative transposon protein TraK n=1 Tax=Dyadobacter psychrotolerans TaxID=2541721 RepID=A0A4R5DCL4_9BACT|nr:conjugative transposon protein TraK [Dyadobacter psychrotolerans]TDE10727.1 conjugative transposon protein TraK [Dyadobacter psychrotolerans]